MRTNSTFGSVKEIDFCLAKFAVVVKRVNSDSLFGNSILYILYDYIVASYYLKRFYFCHPKLVYTESIIYIDPSLPNDQHCIKLPHFLS